MFNFTPDDNRLLADIDLLTAFAKAAIQQGAVEDATLFATLSATSANQMGWRAFDEAVRIEARLLEIAAFEREYRVRV